MKISLLLFSILIISTLIVRCASVNDTAYSWQLGDNNKYYRYNGELRLTQVEQQNLCSDRLIIDQETIIMNFNGIDTCKVSVSCDDRRARYEFLGLAQNRKEIKKLVKSLIKDMTKASASETLSKAQ